MPRSRSARLSRGTLPLMSPPTRRGFRTAPRLRSGDERAFVFLVERYHDSMLRVAASSCPAAVAEEVVRTPAGGPARLSGFEAGLRCGPGCFASSSPDAHHGTREQRSIPSPTRTAVDARVRPDGGWIAPPEQWIEERRAAGGGKLARCCGSRLMTCRRQREIVILRDVEGMSTRSLQCSASARSSAGAAAPGAASSGRHWK